MVPVVRPCSTLLLMEFWELLLGFALRFIVSYRFIFTIVFVVPDYTLEPDQLSWYGFTLAPNGRVDAGVNRGVCGVANCVAWFMALVSSVLFMLKLGMGVATLLSVVGCPHPDDRAPFLASRSCSAPNPLWVALAEALLLWPRSLLPMSAGSLGLAVQRGPWG